MHAKRPRKTRESWTRYGKDASEPCHVVPVTPTGSANPTRDYCHWGKRLCTCGYPCITVPRRESVAEWPSFPRSLYARILRLIATHFQAGGCYTEMQLRLKDVDVRESDHLMKLSWLTPLHCAAPYQGQRLQPRLPVCHHRVRVPHHPGEQAAEFRDPSCTR